MKWKGMVALAFQTNEELQNSNFKYYYFASFHKKNHQNKTFNFKAFTRTFIK